MKYLVELPNGDFVSKEKSELVPTDLICFDGPDADAEIRRANAWLQTQIDEAGGLDDAPHRRGEPRRAGFFPEAPQSARLRV